MSNGTGLGHGEIIDMDIWNEGVQRQEKYKQSLKDKADPEIVANWNADSSQEHQYYCPQCMSIMTKKEVLENLRYELILGYHVYVSGTSQTWQCGPLRIYDSEIDEIKNLVL